MAALGLWVGIKCKQISFSTIPNTKCHVFVGSTPADNWSISIGEIKAEKFHVFAVLYEHYRELKARYQYLKIFFFADLNISNFVSRFESSKFFTKTHLYIVMVLQRTKRYPWPRGSC